MTHFPTLQFEKKLWKKGYLVVGIDEVGRGAFAGPLVVAAVVFEPASNRTRIKQLESLGINDSKKLTARKREELAKVIKKQSLLYATATISVDIINRVGIGKATEMAVRKAVKQVQKKLGQFLALYSSSESRASAREKSRSSRQARTINKHNSNEKLFLLIDAFYIKYVRRIGLANQKAIIHGDEISLSIAAASIIAKVYRDNLMRKLSKKYPLYSLDKHKGYGTKDHRSAIIRFGKTVIHREVFVSSLELRE